MDIRTWLAGCALANPELISESTPPDEAARMATKVADALMLALKAPPPVPDIPTLTDEEMDAWEDEISTTRIQNSRETVIEIRGAARETILPPSTPRAHSSGSTGSTLPSLR